MPEPQRSRLLEVRHGHVPVDEVLAEIAGIEAQVQRLVDAPQVPDEPDHAAVDRFLVGAYADDWASG